MIYADYNGSAPLCSDVKEYLIKRMEGPFANPNAIHNLGQKTLMAMENARSVCAKSIGCLPKQIIFNSGSTEGITQAFYSALDDVNPKDKNIILISGIEHSAVVRNAALYETKGFETRVIPTLPSGLVDVKVLAEWLKEIGDKVALVAVMAANNETGVIQPFHYIAEESEKYNIPFLCDTTQVIGKSEFNFKESKVDFAVCSGHKVGAMTGAGFIMAKNPRKLKELVIGGGQEKALRGGTQNYIGNETLAVALNYCNENKSKMDAIRVKRDEFESKLKKEFPELIIMGEEAPRVACTTYLSHPGIHGQAVQIELESRDIYVTTSSACSDNEPNTSKVLRAMNIGDDVGRGAVRISLGLCAPLNWYDEIFDALKDTFNTLKKIKSY